MEFIRAIIVGSGSSSSTPSLSCVMSGKPCRACDDARAHPQTSRNHRLNPSLLIQLRHPQDGSTHSVLIDCGKTFREAALKVFPQYGVADLSGLLITHAHADACFGLDDLREFSRKDSGGRGGLDVYADRATVLACHKVYGYLFPPVAAAAPLTADDAVAAEDALLQQLTTSAGAGSGWDFMRKGKTWTATLCWHHLHPLTRTTLRLLPRIDSDADGAPAADSPAPEAATWPYVAIPVLHGKDYYSLAFLFTMDDTANDAPAPAAGAAAAAPLASSPRLCLYCSDVSCMDDAFYARLRTAQEQLLHKLPSAAAPSASPEMAGLWPIEVLVLDMLTWNSYYSTHFSGEQSIAAAKTIGAAQTYFVGMSHSMEYSDARAELAKRGHADCMDIAYDGLVIGSRLGGTRDGHPNEE